MLRINLLAALAVLCLPAPALAQGVADRWKAAAETCRDESEIIRQRLASCTVAIDLGSDPASGSDWSMMVAVLGSRAALNVHMGDYGAAIADADLAAAYDDHNAAVETNRCWIRALADYEIDVALAACNKALTISHSYTPTFRTRGLVHLRRGDWESAYADYGRVAEYRFYEDAQYGAGLALIAMGRTDEGYALLRKALQRGSGASEIFDELGYTPDFMRSVAEAQGN